MIDVLLKVNRKYTSNVFENTLGKRWRIYLIRKMYLDLEGSHLLIQRIRILTNLSIDGQTGNANILALLDYRLYAHSKQSRVKHTKVTTFLIFLFYLHSTGSKHNSHCVRRFWIVESWLTFRGSVHPTRECAQNKLSC